MRVRVRVQKAVASYELPSTRQKLPAIFVRIFVLYYIPLAKLISFKKQYFYKLIFFLPAMKAGRQVCRQDSCHRQAGRQEGRQGGREVGR